MTQEVDGAGPPTSARRPEVSARKPRTENTPPGWNVNTASLTSDADPPTTWTHPACSQTRPWSQWENPGQTKIRFSVFHAVVTIPVLHFLTWTLVNVNSDVARPSASPSFTPVSNPWTHTRFQSAPPDWLPVGAVSASHPAAMPTPCCCFAPWLVRSNPRRSYPHDPAVTLIQPSDRGAPV